VAQGRFRDDLYHRLAQFKLDVPPLRDRPEDVLGIAEQVLHEHYPESVFTPDAIDALLCHRWRGNVRELRNVVFRAVLEAQNAQEEITAEDLQLPGTEPREKAEAPVTGDLDDMERQMIFQALEKHGGNQGKAADALGISRRTLLRKLKIYREEAVNPPAGTLSVNQQKYYRADLQLPVMMKYANEQFEGVLLNLSLGGAGIRTDRSLKFGAPVSIYFAIPGTNSAADIMGRVAWTHKEGHHGIQFSDLPSSLRTTLQRWLQGEMVKDGWELETNE
jgi:hypothetical protein